MRGQASLPMQQGGTPGNGTGNATENATSTPTAGGQAVDELVNLFHIPEPIAQAILTLLVVALAWYGAQWFTRTFGRRVARRFKRPSVTRTVLRLMRGGIYALAFLTILGIYDVSLGDITLSVGIFSAVIGIILAPIVGSYIEGVFVLADQPYEVGDMIELVGQDPPQRGFVEDITLRYTQIFTLDNTFLVVPNGTMRNRDVINYSAEDARSRVSLDVLVTYESDVPAARSLIEEAARGVDRVIGGGPDIRIGSARYPAAPTCYINRFGDHGILLRLRYWVREPYKLGTVRSKIMERILDAIGDEDVEMAYPHSHLFVDETSGELPVSLRDDRSPDRRRPAPTDRRADDRGPTERDGGSSVDGAAGDDGRSSDG